MCPREFPDIVAFNGHRIHVHGHNAGSIVPTTREIWPVKRTTWKRLPNPTCSLQRVYLCTQCNDGKRFASHASWKKHRRNAHKDCDSKFRLVKIITTDEYQDGEYECLSCGSEFSHYDHFREHHRKHHPSMPLENGVRVYRPDFKFQCPEGGCGWTFRRHASYEYHMGKFHVGTPLSEAAYLQFSPGMPNDPIETMAMDNSRDDGIEASLSSPLSSAIEMKEDAPADVDLYAIPQHSAQAETTNQGSIVIGSSPPRNLRTVKSEVISIDSSPPRPSQIRLNESEVILLNSSPPPRPRDRLDESEVIILGSSPPRPPTRRPQGRTTQLEVIPIESSPPPPLPAYGFASSGTAVSEAPEAAGPTEVAETGTGDVDIVEVRGRDSHVQAQPSNRVAVTPPRPPSEAACLTSPQPRERYNHPVYARLPNGENYPIVTPHAGLKPYFRRKF
ncbi:hypothetical protein PENSUB_9266 [Penicillium subrubescens]|uniref:C2H2-type domain-containing protein n=2 Tax=Penicillium subrubescens TaxID=1316194 RepID=A0A1Q5TD68_9EURO|nr:hypothetical protein PENSUB_9266 [Penicillium subrubescens]